MILPKHTDTNTCTDTKYKKFILYLKHTDTKTDTNTNPDQALTELFHTKTIQESPHL